MSLVVRGEITTNDIVKICKGRETRTRFDFPDHYDRVADRCRSYGNQALVGARSVITVLCAISVITVLTAHRWLSWLSTGLSLGRS